MRKPFAKLRALMVELDVSTEEMAEVTGVCVTSLRDRLGGRSQWKPLEMLAVLERLGIEPQEVWTYFPPRDLRGR